MTNPATLWQQLQKAGLVSGAQPILNPDDQPPAFFLRVLLSVSGWLSALFFCSFIAGFFISLFSAASNMWVLGVILCGLSIWLSRRPQIPLFLEQFIFACSLSGQAFIIFGILDSSNNTHVTALAVIILEAILFSLIRIRGQRAAAVCIAGGALLWLLGQHAWLYALPLLSAATAWLWLNQVRLYRYRAYLQPATNGLTSSLWFTIFLALTANSATFLWWNISSDNWQTQLWISALLSSAVCMRFAWQLIQKNVQQPKLRYISVCVSLGIGVINLKMPGVAPLCLLLCIGVAHAHTRLVWFNLCALVAYFMLYYYNLNHSLLYKSILLCISGAVLLILYAVLNRYANTLNTEPSIHA